MNDLNTAPPLESISKANREDVEILRSDNDDARLYLLEELGEADNELAFELLRLLRSDDSHEIRGSAAIALGPTLELVDTDLDEEGQIEDMFGVSVWSQAVYEKVVEVLREVTLDEETPKLIRRRSLEAAVRSAKPWQEELVRWAWSSDDPEWRLTAVFAMGYLREIDFSIEIKEAFHSEDVAFRREAIAAAGQRGLVSLLSEISAIAADPKADQTMRYNAIEALGWMGDEDTRELLQKLCNSSSENISDLAEEALQLIDIGLECFGDDGEGEI